MARMGGDKASHGGTIICVFGGPPGWKELRVDIVLLAKAAVMGVVEGLTEFLPISSTGHLILTASLLDIATRLGVAQPTVAKALKRLVKEGWAVQRPYRGVFLTPAGEALAVEMRARHQTVEKFLLALGVDADSARRDAEGIEHHVSEATLAAFEAFVRKANGHG